MPKYKNTTQQVVKVGDKEVQPGATIEAEADEVKRQVQQGSLVDEEQSDEERQEAAKSLGVTPQQNAARQGREPQQQGERTSSAQDANKPQRR